MSGYRRHFDENKHISFLIKDDELLKKYNEIWEKVKNNLKNEFNSEPVYNEKYLKAKLKFCNGKINTNFDHNKIVREGSQSICLSVILINFLFKTGENLYRQLFLGEWKYIFKEKRFQNILVTI